MALQDVKASLEKAKLAPGSAASLIPDGFEPTVELRVEYAGDKPVSLGNLLRVADVKLSPAVSFSPEPGASSSASYMLLLVDPDAPTPEDPKFAFWRHWVLPGLQPLSGTPASTDTGTGTGPVVAQTKPALTQYLAPGPKDDVTSRSTPHRYLFLLFREPNGLDLTKDQVGGEEFVQRRSFQAAEFIAKHNLVLVGVNWMLGAGNGWKET
ncbi:phosphatidylethanolamine-binding protein [Stachybotrys elegans]|uniref:Phosphatidylethanolamine-binding protein n=1 Tax=Stachybotrys elegans TaxID=80388 RepID=A0A8K0SR53_9HYPO|nr:phosphatidylethanolamine-binding protein [Stachybotrys elegans]